jgi:hypothetical protein
MNTNHMKAAMDRKRRLRRFAMPKTCLPDLKEASRVPVACLAEDLSALGVVVKVIFSSGS